MKKPVAKPAFFSKPRSVKRVAVAISALAIAGFALALFADGSNAIAHLVFSGRAPASQLFALR